MNTEQTKGKWIAKGKGGTSDGGSSMQHPCFNGSVVSETGQVIIQQSSFLGVQGATPEEAEANANLIAEAGTVLNETGLTPRQLKEENERLVNESAELMSLKNSISGSDLKDFFPKKEDISFHDKTIFAIAELREQMDDLLFENEILTDRVKDLEALVQSI